MMTLDMAPRDLLLRPTTLEPGIYTADTEEGPSCFMVTRHQDGGAYEMIWCDAGEGASQRQTGDLLFTGVSFTGQTLWYPKDGPLGVEPV